MCESRKIAKRCMNQLRKKMEKHFKEKSKIEVAAALRAACNNLPGILGPPENYPEILEATVEKILRNKKSLADVDDEKTIDWCKWLVAGGYTPEEFAKKAKSYDKTTTCGQVWTENFVAYRCRTCGISPYLSLCTECFQRGNHEGHDFIVFRSETGGACDCGEINVIKPSGCCSLHGPGGTAPPIHDESLGQMAESSELPEMFRVATDLMPYFLQRLIAFLRAVEARTLARAEQLLNNKNASSRTKKSTRQKLSPPPATSLAATAAAMIQSNPAAVASPPPPKGQKFIKLLQDFSDMGMTMRQVMTTALTSSSVYTRLCGEGSLPQEYVRLGLRIPTNSETFLDELVYWTVKQEFPEDLVCLILSLRSHSSYNLCLAKAFIIQYNFISQTILYSTDPERLSKHIAAVSVQLFSKEKLALAMVQQMKLLKLIQESLHDMIRSAAVPISSVLVLLSMKSSAEQKIDNNEEQGINQSTLMVIDCDNDIIKNNYYWLLKSDLKEILSHGSVAMIFFSDPELLSNWFEFLTLMQGMNVNKFVRKGEPHVEHESDSYVGAFMAELVISATLMCTLVGHLKDSSTSEITLNFIRLCMAQLKRWFQQVNYPIGTISFHLPLHRYLSTFIRQGMQWQEIPMEKILPAEDDFREIVVRQLLRLQTAYYGISNRLWARNGSSLVNQAEYYVSSLCCNSMVDADLFLLQVEAVRKPDAFLEMLLEEFGVESELSIQNLVRESRAETQEEKMDWVEDPQEQMTMLENFMIFLATLASVRTNLGMPEQELLALEMSVLLCKSDRLHSELIDMLPERCSSGNGSGDGTFPAPTAGASIDAHQKNLNEVLEKIADFQAPRNMQQGIFTPKSIIWEEIYDPVYTLMRSSSRAEYQSSRDRYQDWVSRARKQSSSSGGGGDGANVKNLWPPYRLPPQNDPNRFMEKPSDILKQKRFMEVAFVVLYHGVYTGLLGELTIGMCVFMLEILVHSSSTNDEAVLRGLTTNVLLPGKKDDDGESENEVWKKGESVVSLLMQLYKKLSENGKQFRLKPDCVEEEMPSERSPESRIGDGPFFIGKVLDKLAEKWEDGKSYIQEEIQRQTVRQGQCGGGFLEFSSEEREREEKRRKAKERRKHIMDDLAMKRQQFMEYESTGDENRGQSIDDDEDGAATSPQPQQDQSDLLQQYEEHECVICMEKLQYNPNFPFGLMTYLSPCNILGYQKLQKSKEQREEEEKRRGKKEKILDFLKDVHKETLTEYLTQYDDSSVIQHVSLDPGFGVQVQSCGHLIHQNCFTSYMEYVKKPPTSSQGFTSTSAATLKAGKTVIKFTYKEYSCPLCRQLGNSFLPIIPTSLVKSPSASLTVGDFSEISKMIKKRNKCILSNEEQKAVDYFIHDINACGWNNFEKDLNKILKEFDVASPLVSAFLLTSHLRQAVERQLKLSEAVASGGGGSGVGGSSSVTPSSSSAESKKISSLLPLLSVLKYQYKNFPVGYARKLALNWEMACGKRASKGRELPTLLREVETALYHFVLDLPLMSNPTEIYNCVVQALYNLRVVQMVFTVCSQLSESERREVEKNFSKSTDKFEVILGQTAKTLCKFAGGGNQEFGSLTTVVATETVTNTNQDENGNHNHNSEGLNLAYIKNLMELGILPFLETAAYLKSVLYGKEYNSSQNVATLAEFLELGGARRTVSMNSEDMDGEMEEVRAGGKTCVDYVYWGDGGSVLEQESLIANWCLELMSSFSNGAPTKQQRSIDVHESISNGGAVDRAAKLLKSYMFLYNRPCFIDLAPNYSIIFEAYRKKECDKCEQLPNTPAVCLICGQVLCLKNLCCFDVESEVSEVVSHSQKECCKGTGLFISVLTSEVLIVREKEACIWGSLYLDSFSEEDLELKRGKPLYLCQERLDILKRNWLAQSFYKMELKWFLHQNML